MPTIKQQSPKPTVKKGGNVIDRIVPMEHMEVGGIKINLYGRSASGKTTFWSTFPGDILAIICSGSDKPGELRSVDTPELRKKIKQVVIESPVEVGQLVTHIKAHPNLFKTVVLDHATGLQDLILKGILGLDELPPQLSWGLATREQYGQVALQMKEMLRALLGLTQHVVIVAQERDFSKGEGESEVTAPFVASALSPSVVGWLNPACDYICQTFIRGKTQVKKVKIGDKEMESVVRVPGVEYCLRTAPHDVFATKFRVPKGHPLPEVIVDPTFDKVMKVITGK